MAKVEIDGDSLIVEIEGSDKLWALKSRLIIPLANVLGATADPGVIKEPKGIRAPGAHVPGVITAGTFHIHGERSSGTSTTRPRPSSWNWPTNTTPASSYKSPTPAPPSRSSKTPPSGRDALNRHPGIESGSAVDVPQVWQRSFPRGRSHHCPWPGSF